MGIISDVIGGGLVALGKLAGVLLIFLAILSLGIAVVQENPMGYVFALVFFIVGAGLYRY